MFPQIKKADFSVSFLFGAHGSRLEEPLGWIKTYPIQWREPRVNLTELAKLRWIEGWDRKQLADHFGRTEVAVQNYFQEIRKKGFRLPGLNEGDRRRIQWALKS